MPLYDYRCEAGHRYEKREPFGSSPHPPCDRCGKPAHRVLTAPTVVFKGSGWYSTDSQRTLRSGVGEDRGSSSDDGDGGSDDAAGSDEKPAYKPTAKKPAAEKKPAAKAKPAASSEE